MHEVGNDLLPYVAEHYATRASDGSREALRAAREHFGVLGASFGAYAGYLSVIADNYDLAAWYTFCGGGEIDPGYLMNGWTNTGTQDLPLKLLYLSSEILRRSVYRGQYPVYNDYGLGTRGSQLSLRAFQLTADVFPGRKPADDELTMRAPEGQKRHLGKTYKNQ